MSDLHFGITPDEKHLTTAIQRRDSVLSLLIDKLEDISRTNMKPDILVISGDIGWHAKEVDYKLASKWLNRLLKSIRLLWDDVIICAGNHDIDRSRLTDNFLINSQDTAQNMLAIENIEERGSHFENYIEFLRTHNMVCYTNSALDPEEKIKYLYGYRIHKGICFVSWNSAWNCKGGDLGNLYIGEPLVLDMKSIIPKNQTIVSVMHHPFYWLQDQEQYVYGHGPASVDGVVNMSHIILNGHVHGQIREATHYQNKSYVFTSGATYEREHYQLSCQIIQLDLDNKSYSTQTISYNPIAGEWDYKDFEKSTSFCKGRQLSNANAECYVVQSPATNITNDWKNTVKHFLGRRKDIKSIVELMENDHKNNEKTALWIYGMGGLGKTQLCRKLYSMFENQYSYIGWITCQGDFNSSLVNSVMRMKQTDNLDEAYQSALDYINFLGKKLVLFIDNYDSIDSYIGDIEALKCHVIITSRNKNPDTFTGYELGFLSFRHCKALFRRFYTLEDNVVMNEIIHKTGYLALAIELVAKTGQKMALPLKEFYQKLDEKGFDIKTVIRSNWDNKGEKLNTELSRHFSIVFDLTNFKSNPEALYILKNFSILPYLGVKQQDVIDWLALNQENNYLVDLVDSGWLQRLDFKYVMHPIISHTVKNTIHPIFLDCSNLIAALSKCIQVKATDNFLASLIYLPYASSVGRYFKTNHNINANSAAALALLFIRIADVYRHNGEYQISLDWAYQAERALRETPESNGFIANIIYNILSEICLDMRNRNQESRDWAIRAMESDNKSDDIDDLIRSTSFHNLACAYIQLGENKLALKNQLEAVRLRENDLPQDSIRLANAYRNLAMIYRRLKKTDDAYEYQKKVIDILEEKYVDDENHPDFPVAYSLYSFIQRDKGNIKEAIRFQEKATLIREAVNENDPKLAINYNNLGIFNLENNNPEEAIKWQEKALQVDLRHRGPKHPDVAMDYFNYAKILYALENSTEAIKYLLLSRSIENECDLNPANIKEIDELILQYAEEQ